jgi:hypothetical protein
MGDKVEQSETAKTAVFQTARLQAAKPLRLSRDFSNPPLVDIKQGSYPLLMKPQPEEIDDDRAVTVLKGVGLLRCVTT